MYGPRGGTVPGACVITQAVTPASKDFSAEGALDWLTLANQTVPPRLISPPGNLHAKQTGKMHESFDWIMAAGTLGTFSPCVPLMTTQASDDTAAVALAALNTAPYIFVAGSDTGHGFRFRAPAGRTTRTLHLYCGVYSGIITVEVSASDGSFVATTSTLDSGAATPASKDFKIDFNCGSDGTEIVVRVHLTTNHGAGNVSFVGATVA